MGTILVLSLAQRAGGILNDAGFVQWTLDDLLGWFNDAQRAVAMRRPDAYSFNTDYNCVLGAKQTIPPDGYRLIDVVRNLLGSAVRRIDKKILDAQYRSWYLLAPVEDIEHFTYDDRDPAHFYTYPPAIDGLQLEIIYSRIPADVVVVDGSEAITLSDAYAEPILEYMLFRAFSKDAQSNPARVADANLHYTAFRTALGDDTQASATMSPSNG